RRRDVLDRARRMRRDPRPERLGQVDARSAAVDAAAARRRYRGGLRPRRLPPAARGAAARQPRFRRGVLLQEDVLDRESELRRPVLRDDCRRDAGADPGDPRSGRIPREAAPRVDGAPLPRYAAEGLARTSAPYLAGA